MAIVQDIVATVLQLGDRPEGASMGIVIEIVISDLSPSTVLGGMAICSRGDSAQAGSHSLEHRRYNCPAEPQTS